MNSRGRMRIGFLLQALGPGNGTPRVSSLTHEIIDRLVERDVLVDLIIPEDRLLDIAEVRAEHYLYVLKSETPEALLGEAIYPDVVFAQRYLSHARRDLKVFGIGEKFFGVRKAFGADSFLRAGEPARLSPEVEDLARGCGRAFGLELYGLDLAEEEDGPYVIDVNYFPGYRGVPDAGRHLAEYILRAAKG